jgi:hypothetical protein
VDDNLFHWSVRLFGFEASLPLAADLAAYATRCGMVRALWFLPLVSLVLAVRVAVK